MPVVFDLAFGDCRARAEGCVANGAGMGGGIDLGRRGPVTQPKKSAEKDEKSKPLSPFSLTTDHGQSRSHFFFFTPTKKQHKDKKKFA